MAHIVDPHNFAAGQVADAEQVDARFAAVLAQVNGNLDADNLAANAVDASALGDTVPRAIGAFSARPSANQSAPTGTTLVTLEVEDFDVSNWFSASTYTPQVPGVYRFNCNIGFASAIPELATVQAIILKNSAGHVVDSRYGSAPSNNHVWGGSVLLTANGTTDTFRLQAYHANGDASEDLQATSIRFQGELVGRL